MFLLLLFIWVFNLIPLRLSIRPSISSCRLLTYNCWSNLAIRLWVCLRPELVKYSHHLLWLSTLWVDRLYRWNCLQFSPNRRFLAFYGIRIILKHLNYNISYILLSLYFSINNDFYYQFFPFYNNIFLWIIWLWLLLESNQINGT